MRIFIALWIFYQKLIFPSLVVAVLLAIISCDAAKIVSGIGIAYVFLVPVFHFVLYDLTSPKEYYFYYNMGINKLWLWITSIVVSLIVGLILMLI